MKYNLENRPKLDDVYDYDEASRRKAIDKLYKIEEWFVGFEKQLRDIQKLFKEKIGVDAFIPIKEILGEENESAVNSN